MIGGYRRTLDIALRHQFITLLVFLATVALTVVLYIQIPKGFFPPQDTGVVLGISEGAQEVSFKEMTRVQAALNEVVSQDPDVQAYAATVGAGIGGQTTNNGRMFIALKPWDQRAGGTAQDFISRIRPKAAEGDGRRAVPERRAGHPRRRPHHQDRVPVHPAGRRPGRAVPVGAEDPRQAEEPADAARCRHRPADGRA